MLSLSLCLYATNKLPSKSQATTPTAPWLAPSDVISRNVLINMSNATQYDNLKRAIKTNTLLLFNKLT